MGWQVLCSKELGFEVAGWMEGSWASHAATKSHCRVELPAWLLQVWSGLGCITGTPLNTEAGGVPSGSRLLHNA